jgi:hypothetical protein
MSEKLAHDEVSRRGGLSRSPRKMAAIQINLAKAKAALSAKRAERRCSAAPPA